MGRDHLSSVGDRLVINLGLHRVCRVLLNLQGVESLRGCRESGRLHVGEMVLEHHADGSLEVDVVGEVQEDFVGADVGFLGRMDPCEVSVLDEDWVVRRR